jgi:N-ethylmaleimide reductase
MDQNSMLFSTFMLSGLKLKNRVVMAPMTRCRALGNVPNEIMAKYYEDRAGAGLIITEGTAPSPDGLGYARIPGIYSGAQVKGWERVTRAVRKKGGRIFLQLMHTGRMGHPLNLPEGGELLGPSAIAAAGEMWTDAQGMQPMPVPKEIPTAEIGTIIAQYVHSAILAIDAGFDGVEIHAANGYLPMQFLNPKSNQRTDKYGGNHENRNRFVLELVEAMTAAIGKEKVGIRLSPFNTYNDMAPDPQEAAQYLALTEGLEKTGLAYIHLLTFAMPQGMLEDMHRAFEGAFILNGGYTAERAEADLQAGKCGLVSFGTPFIANPDLVQLMLNDGELAKADPALFYTPGEKGYNEHAVA